MKKMLSFLLAFSMVCSSLAISAQAEEAAALPEQAEPSAQAAEQAATEEAAADDLSEAAVEAEAVAEPAPEAAPEAEAAPETEAVAEVQAEPAPEAAPELEPETVAEAQPEEAAAPENVDLDTYEAESNGFVYTTSGTNATINAYTGTAASVSIPEKLGGCTVTEIGMNAFAGHSEIKTLVIPKTVSSFGIQAFMNCTGLTDVTINSTELSVSARAFENTGAMKVTFGEGIRKIPMQMFSSAASKADNTYCHIISLKLPASLLEIDYAAFQNCYDLKEVEWGSGIETVGRFSFNNTGLKSVVLPDSVKTIDYNAFSNNASLTKLVIPKNVEKIGNNAFLNCTALTDVTINAAQMNVGADVFRNTGAMKVVFGEGVRIIPKFLFTSTAAKMRNEYCRIVSVKMSSTILEVGFHAFANCYDLEEVVWGSGLETIGNAAFENTKLKSVVLPEGVRKIDDYAFLDNTELKTIVLPTTAYYLNNYAFSGCTALTDVTINTTNMKAGYFPFYNTGAFKAVFGEGVRTVPDGLFRTGSTKAENKYCHIVSVEIPTSVLEIGTYAFSNCHDLVKATVKSRNAVYATYSPFTNVPTALTFYCYKSSTTDDFAKRDKYKIIYLETPEDEGVKGFVNRLYSVCLGREPDAAGQADWVNQLTSYRISGTTAAKGFIFSPEFKNKNYNNADYVEHLYFAFMGRASDINGKNDWVGKLDAGMSREDVFTGFANSTEFDKLCNSYGIVSKDIETFVTRLYSVCLDRKPDNGGLADWATKLRGKAATGRGVAYGFVFSPEFQNKKYSNEDYVEHLYAAFMGRASDAAGKADWVGKMKAGMTREQVFDGFVGSQEFTDICTGYGIDRG